MLLSIASVRGTGLGEMSELNPHRARLALERAKRIAVDLGAHPAAELVNDEDATAVLLDATKDADVLVVGGRDMSRLAGIMLGSRASIAVHRATVPVLVARHTLQAAAFPERILVASDGSSAARDAVELAGALAARHNVDVFHLHVGGWTERRGHRHELSEETELLRRATGKEPVALSEHGDAPARIAEVAARIGSSVIVVGSRGVGGIKALGSVSERVAHEARCSVLVVRPSRDRDGA